MVHNHVAEMCCSFLAIRKSVRATRVQEAILNPHQRCGYSGSPFARIHFFYTAGSRNRFEGMDPVCRHTKKQKTISKRHFFLIEKCFGPQTGWKTHPESAGIDNSASWSCKRRVTANFVQDESIWVASQHNQGFNFLDSRNPKFSRRRPMPAFLPLGFKQCVAPLGAKYFKR